jgi:hypothetical protein
VKTKKTRSRTATAMASRAVVLEHDDDEDDVQSPPQPALEDDDQGVGAEQDLDDELRQLDAELGEDANAANVVVHKIVTNGDQERCFSCPRSEFFTDQIRDEWGAGTYAVRVYVGGRLRKRRRLKFAERVKPPAPASTTSIDGTLRDIEARFEKQLERERAQNMELLRVLAGNRPALDPLQMQQQTLALLATAKELTGGGAKAQGSDRSAIELFLEGVKMAQKLGAGGGEGGGTDWTEVALGVVEGVKAIAAQPAAVVPRALPPPASNNSPAPTPAADTPGGDTVGPMGDLKKHLAFLVRKAAGNADASLYAEVTLDSLNDLPAYMQSIAVDYIRRDDALDRLAMLEPAIAQHREWFQRLVDEIRQQLSAQSGGDALTDGAGTTEAS